MIDRLVSECADWALLAYDRSGDPNPYIHLLRDAQGIRGFVLETSLSVIVSIRGTASIPDALTDAKVFKVPFDEDPKLLVHAGCHEEYEIVWPEIKPFLKPSKHLVFTGHSLGAGIATLLIWKTVRTLRFMPDGVTFGSLRVMTPEAAEVFDRDVPSMTRVVHNLDVVPRVPKIDYAHVGKLLHLTDRGRVIGDYKGGCLESFFWHLWMDGRKIGSDFTGVAYENHHMPTYVTCVNGWYNRQLRKEWKREAKRAGRKVPDQTPE